MAIVINASQLKVKDYKNGYRILYPRLVKNETHKFISIADVC